MSWVFVAALAMAALWLFTALRAARESHGRELTLLRGQQAVLQNRSLHAEHKLKALSESSGAGIVILNAKGLVVQINRAAEQLFGLEPESLIGHSFIQATLSNNLQEFALAAIGQQQPRSEDFKLPGASGRILRTTIFPFAQGLSDEPESMLVMVDITELKKLETMRRDFVANVSHELRTPLTSIRAMAETLQDGALHDEKVAMGFLATIVKEADRLARISEDLLILADAESKAPERVRFDLTDMVREVTARFRSESAESGVSLATELPGPTFISASRDQMEQVVINLVSNAIKYTSRGGNVSIEVANGGPMVSMAVSDTGIGIMQEDLPRIFERFYRVDKARSRQSGGTGLGLSIVKNIVEAHGGEVRVASEFNRGSCFTVSLPSGKE